MPSRWDWLPRKKNLKGNVGKKPKRSLKLILNLWLRLSLQMVVLSPGRGFDGSESLGEGEGTDSGSLCVCVDEA